MDMQSLYDVLGNYNILLYAYGLAAGGIVGYLVGRMHGRIESINANLKNLASIIEEFDENDSMLEDDIIQH
jgi:hypothetical protein